MTEDLTAAPVTGSGAQRAVALTIPEPVRAHWSQPEGVGRRRRRFHLHRADHRRLAGRLIADGTRKRETMRRNTFRRADRRHRRHHAGVRVTPTLGASATLTTADCLRAAVFGRDTRRIRPVHESVPQENAGRPHSRGTPPGSRPTSAGMLRPPPRAHTPRSPSSSPSTTPMRRRTSRSIARRWACRCARPPTAASPNEPARVKRLPAAGRRPGPGGVDISTWSRRLPDLQIMFVEADDNYRTAWPKLLAPRPARAPLCCPTAMAGRRRLYGSCGRLREAGTISGLLR